MSKKNTIAITGNPLAGNVYTVLSERYQKWALYQVVLLDDQGIGLVALDWFTDRFPAPDELPAIKPLLVQHHSWKSRPDAFYVADRTVPEAYRFVGQAPLRFTDPIHTYRFGIPLSGTLTAEAEHKWMQLDKTVRDAYKQALNSPQQVMYAGDMHWNNNTQKSILAHTSFNWHSLDVFPMLTSLNVRGEATGLLEYCAARPLLTKLSWMETGQRILDFTTTHLEDSHVDITGVEQIVLNPAIETFGLAGDYANLPHLQITQPGLQGRYCELVLNDLRSFPVPRYELPRLRTLTIRCDACDARQLVDAYPNVEELTIRGNPGTVVHLNALKKLRRLRKLMLVDLFGYTASDFPAPEDIPHIESVWLSSIPQEVGRYVRLQYRQLPDLHVEKLRDADWLKINARNPFRSWDGRENIRPAHAKKAFDVYKQTGAALQKLRPEAQTEAVLLPLIKNFVLAFTKMDGRSRLETIEREEIGEVLTDLVSPLPVELQDQAFSVFNELRTF